jgi:hypothetical protein
MTPGGHVALPQRAADRPYRLRRRILIPFIAGVGVLLSAFVVNAYWLGRQNAHRSLDQDLTAVHKAFQEELDRDSREMASTLKLIATDDSLRAAMAGLDQEALLRIATPIYTRLHHERGFMQFCFVGPDRTCILRVHQPERYGDTIDRFTTLEAERTGRAASGLELGVLGTFGLRTVIPWRDGPRLIGYIELGHDISHLTAELHDMFGVEYCALVNSPARTGKPACGCSASRPAGTSSIAGPPS